MSGWILIIAIGGSSLLTPKYSIERELPKEQCIAMANIFTGSSSVGVCIGPSGEIIKGEHIND